MVKVLHICATPKVKASASRHLSSVFLDAYRRRNPDHEVRELRLFDATLPEFGPDEITAKFAPLLGDEVSQAQQMKWDTIRAVIADFLDHDKILLSTPMWNYGLPYKLKQYIDIIVQPHLTFGYDLEAGTHFGLVDDRPVQLILTRSSVLPGDPGDFQLPYLKHIFGFIGINDVRSVIAPQTTRFTAKDRQDYLDSFAGELAAAAQAF